MRKGLLFFVLLIWASVGCKPDGDAHSHHSEGEIEYGNIELPQYAKGFYVDRHSDYTLLVFPDLLKEEGESRFVYLTKEGADIKDVKATVIQLPVKELACLSTTHLAMIDLLDAWDLLKGLAYADKVIDNEYLDKIEQHAILNLSSGWNLDQEKIMSVQPEVFLTYPYEDEAQSALQSDQFETLALTEYLEPHPLGRAEWIKVIGCLLGKEKEAEAAFNHIVSQYQEIEALIDSSAHRPVTFTGSHYQGQWAVPGGKSLAAQFITDAGGDYYFSDDEGRENLTIDYETLVSASHEIEWWGTLGNFGQNLAALEIAGSDERVLEFDAFTGKRLFYCNTDAVDYFGRGVMEPHEMLKDLHAIYTPAFRKEHTFQYFFLLSDD